MPIIAILAAVQDAGANAVTGQARLTAVIHCVADAGSTDVTVCGRRRADRYRVPLIVHDPGDRHYESVANETARLIHRTTPMDDRGPFLVGGGFAGVSATVGASGHAVVEGARPIAP